MTVSKAIDDARGNGKNKSVELRKLLIDLTSTLSELGEIEPAAHIDELCKEWSDPELRVVIFGEFSRGKSTLINALIGRPVLPAKLIPTTGHVTRVLVGQRDIVRVHYENGEVEQCDLDHLDSLSSLNLDGVAREEIARLDVTACSAWLKTGIILIDTPGLKDRDAQTSRAKRAIAQADLVLLVLDARQLLTDHERALATKWLTSELGKRVVAVVNFMNVLESDKDRRDVSEVMDSWAGHHLQPLLDRSWFGINALGALKHAIGKGPETNDDFEALRSGLRSLASNPRRLLQLQRLARSAQIRAETQAVRKRNAEMLDSLRNDLKAVAAERAEQARSLKETARRFDIDVAVNRQELEFAIDKIFAQKLKQLTTDWRKKTKKRLEAHASDWVADKLRSALMLMEREASIRLKKLTKKHCLDAIDPLTLTETHDLGIRPSIEVDESQTNEGVGASEYLGDFLGTWGMPIGNAVDAAWDYLTSIFNAPDYPGLYIAKVEERWPKYSRRLKKRLIGQFNNRAAQGTKQIEGRRAVLNKVVTSDLNIELRQREGLERLLDRCLESVA